MNITFFYPSIELGGAELLFARMAIFLSTKGHKITIVDSNKRIILNLCEGHDLAGKIVGLNQRVSVKDTYLVAFANNTFNLNNYLDIGPGVKIMFWNVHPFNVILLPPLVSRFLLSGRGGRLKWFNSLFFRSIYNKRRDFIAKAVVNKSFFIMDGECCDTISEHYSLDFTKNVDVFLPVPIMLVHNKNVINEVEIGTVINIFWYGRLCDFKFYGLMMLIDELKECDLLFKLHIIGDGDKSETVLKKCVETNIPFVHYGTLNNSDAIQLIATTAQCVFAMGTSALECASLGIPTILAPVSYSPIERKVKYEWLYETKKYTLGRFIKKEDYVGDVGFDVIINKMLHDYKNISTASKDYVNNNHNLSLIAQQLLEKLAQSQTTKEDLLNESENFIYRIHHFLKFILMPFKRVK